MNAAMIVAAWLLPLLLGGSAWIIAAGWPRRFHQWLAAFGGGWLLGVAVSGFAMQLASRLLGRPAFAVAAVVVAGLAVPAIAGAWRRRRSIPEAVIDTPEAPLSMPTRVAVFALLAVLILRWALLGSDILLHPTLPWDAWVVWLAKAKAWLLSGTASPYVGFDAWLSASEGSSRTSAAWTYPEWLPWTLVWFAQGMGWIEPYVNAVWGALWLALLAVFYSSLRHFGLRTFAATAAAYALASLPLAEAHVALGGYADLWIAAYVLLGANALLRWRTRGESTQLAVLGAAMVTLAFVKNEGAVWSLLLGFVAAWPFLRRSGARNVRMWLAALGLFAALAAIAVWSGWLDAVLGHIGGVSGIRLGCWWASAQAFAVALWAQSNWNLLWFVLPVALWVERRRWWAVGTARTLAMICGLAVAMVFALFALTDASKFALSFSAINRLLLQLSPLLVQLLAFALAWPPAVPESAQSDVAAEVTPPIAPSTRA